MQQSDVLVVVVVAAAVERIGISCNACVVALTTATGVARKATGKNISIPVHTTSIAKRARNESKSNTASLSSVERWHDDNAS